MSQDTRIRKLDGTWVQINGEDGIDGADGEGVPTGGATGEVLAKVSGTDFDTEWVAQTGGASALDDLTDVDTTGVADGDVLTFDSGGSEWVPVAPAAAVSDGDKGDITVSSSGTVWTIDNQAVTAAKIANDTITDAQLAANSVTASELADNAVDTAAIADDAVTNAELANVSTATIKGRVTGGTGNPEDLTGTQATTLLDVFTSGLKGLAPASGGGTTNFLRADGTWVAGGAGADGAWGGAITIPYLFSTTTTDSDPGNGNMRLNNATQSSATVVRLDELDVNGGDWQDLVSLIGGGSSVTLALLRLVREADPTEWVLYEIFTIVDATGYMNLTCSAIATGSQGGANFLSNAEACYVLIDRVGDKGDDGSTPSSIVAYAERTSDVTGISTTTVDLTGVTVTFTAVAGRQYKITGQTWIFSTTGGSPAFVATQIADGSNATKGLTYTHTASGFAASAHVEAVETPGAGSVTYKLRAATNSGTVALGAAADFPAFILVEDLSGDGVGDADYGDITVSGGGGTWTIDNDVVTNAKAANVATATIKGRVTASTGDPEDLTGTQATTLLDVFTSGLKGVAPSSGGGTTNFLRADGTWAAPPGGGGGTGGYPLPHSAWRSISGAASNLVPASGALPGTMADPKLVIPVWSFDPGQSEHIQTDPFVMPADYASGGTLILKWMANDTGATETCRWSARVSAVTAGDADTILEHALSSAASVDTDVNTTEARRAISSSITLNMDSAAAGDIVTILLYREGGHGNDDLSSDAELITAVLEYTKA